MEIHKQLSHYCQHLYYGNNEYLGVEHFIERVIIKAFVSRVE